MINVEMDMMNRNLKGKQKQAAEAHRANIQKSLQHRLEGRELTGTKIWLPLKQKLTTKTEYGRVYAPA